jgi:hypothetical protein
MKLKQSTFDKGMIIFISAFPTINVVNEVYWEMMKDLEDDFFIPAITFLVKNTSDKYPINAPIGMIREKCFELATRHYRSQPALPEPRPVINGSLMAEFEKTINNE